MSPHPTFAATAAPACMARKIPTKQHCLKVKRLLGCKPDENAIIYHRGAVSKNREGTDVELEFRQDSHFFYLTGKQVVETLVCKQI